MPPKPMVIRFSLGDAYFLWETMYVAVKQRSWKVVHNSLWIMRENRRRGTWEPWTLGDFILLRRKRRWLASRTREGPYPKIWRHSNRQEE